MEAHKNFILQCISQVTKRYVDIYNDEEYSIGLLAFHEAIDQYDLYQNVSFLSFASLVIRRRIIDHIRAQQKYKLILPMSSFSHDDEENIGIENLVTVHFDEYFEISISKEEILLLTQTLLQYKISFSDLVRLTPKHKDTKKRVFSIVHIILQNPAFLNFLLQNKKLPIALLCKEIYISRITIERHRKYIIAMTILLSGPYENLQKYVKEVHNL